MLTLDVIIPTLNRETVLCETLSTLFRLSNDAISMNIHVVDQTLQHSPSTQEFLRLAAESQRITHHRVEFANLPKARNYGIEHTESEIILFLDDDIEASETLISSHLNAYGNQSIWGVAGSVLLPNKNKRSATEVPTSEMKQIREGKISRFDVDFPYLATWAPGCNMSFRRSALLHIGGFDEGFRGSAIGEDTELSYRIRKAGGTIAYVPDAEVLHKVNPEGGCRDESDNRRRVIDGVENSTYFWARVETSPWNFALRCAGVYLDTLKRKGQSPQRRVVTNTFCWMKGTLNGISRSLKLHGRRYLTPSGEKPSS